VLNLNISASKTGGVISCDPVNVTAAFRLPAWLQGRTLDVFSVDVYDPTGIVNESANSVGDELQFTYPELASKKLIVITADPGARAAMTATITDMKARLTMIAPRR